MHDLPSNLCKTTRMNKRKIGKAVIAHALNVLTDDGKLRVAETHVNNSPTGHPGIAKNVKVMLAKVKASPPQQGTTAKPKKRATFAV